MSFTPDQIEVIYKAMPYLESEMPSIKGMTKKIIYKDVHVLDAHDFTGAVLEVCYGRLKASILDSQKDIQERYNESVIIINKIITKHL